MCVQVICGDLITQLVVLTRRLLCFLRRLSYLCLISVCGVSSMENILWSGYLPTQQEQLKWQLPVEMLLWSYWWTKCNRSKCFLVKMCNQLILCGNAVIVLNISWVMLLWISWQLCCCLWKLIDGRNIWIIECLQICWKSPETSWKCRWWLKNLS